MFNETNMKHLELIKALSEKDPERESEEYDKGLKQMKEWVLSVLEK
jgi:hypothetical protein